MWIISLILKATFDDNIFVGKTSNEGVLLGKGPELEHLDACDPENIVHSVHMKKCMHAAYCGGAVVLPTSL